MPSNCPAPSPEFFESLFEGNEDPWSFKTRWYEERKRALTLAALPTKYYQSAYEPGCANGELSAALATRCGRLLVSDGASGAVALARQRVAGIPHVSVVQAQTPQAWPDERFDLVVISELGYFLEESSLRVLAQKTKASLEANGTVVACHWRKPIAGCSLDGDAVHRILSETLGLARLSELVEADFRLEVWCTDSRSVGDHEGLA